MCQKSSFFLFLIFKQKWLIKQKIKTQKQNLYYVVICTYVYMYICTHIYGVVYGYIYTQLMYGYIYIYLLWPHFFLIWPDPHSWTAIICMYVDTRPGIASALNASVMEAVCACRTVCLEDTVTKRPITLGSFLIWVGGEGILLLWHQHQKILDLFMEQTLVGRADTAEQWSHKWVSGTCRGPSEAEQFRGKESGLRRMTARISSHYLICSVTLDKLINLSVPFL